VNLNRPDTSAALPAMGEAFTVRARWIFPVAAPPLRGAAVEFDAAGRVLSIHQRAPAGAHDLGDVALIPGLVNTHAHLEFSELADPLQPSQPFPAWLRSVVAYRRNHRDVQQAIRTGLAESRSNGTVALGEIETLGDVAQESGPGPRIIIAFRELLGPSPDAIERQLEIARQFLDEPRTNSPSHVIRGLSPHAPYSVHPELLEQTVSLAKTRKSIVAIHLAETRSELQCLAAGKGELVDLFIEAGIWPGPLYAGGAKPLDILRQLESLPRVVVAHGNYLDDEELDFLAGRPNFALAYCPRTHAFFGHEEHPWRGLEARGGIVAIGTDGRSSNPDLSVWHELQFIRKRFPDYDPAAILRMGTIQGARALGLDDRIGTIELGKSPGLAVIRLGHVGTADPYEELFHEDSEVLDLLAN
jgi:cytosine/adenosine deaminase-related metal-dependent hydrolase